MQDICQIGQAEATPQSSGPGDEPITQSHLRAKPLARTLKPDQEATWIRVERAHPDTRRGGRWMPTCSVDQPGAQMVGEGFS
jgi:hypothetical protein